MIVANEGKVMMAGDFVDNISETLSVIDSLRIKLDSLVGSEKAKDNLIKEVSEDIVDVFFLGIDKVAHRHKDEDDRVKGDRDGNIV